MNLKEEEKDCKLFLKDIFENKEYLNIISFEPKNKTEIQNKTLEGLLKGNEIYKQENNLHSIYDVEDVQEFLFKNKSHEIEVYKKIKETKMEKEQKIYSESISGIYKNHILNNQ